jgi:hypothetical protein
MSEMVHIGVEFNRGKYAGVSLTKKDAKGRYRHKIFGGCKDDFHQDLMDALIECIRKDYRAMWSSSVDHYVMDTKSWGWSKNGCVGEYVFPIKKRHKAWHQFTKTCGRKDRKLVWIQSKGKMVVIEGDDKFTFKVLHSDATDPILISAQSVEEVFEKVKDAKVKNTLEL